MPTIFVEPGTAEELSGLVDDAGWAEFVVKPAVAASAIGARRFARDEARFVGEAHLRTLLRRGTALVQPWVAAVDTLRERSLVFVDGQLKHACTKPAFNADVTGSTVLRPHEPSGAECALAAAAMTCVPGAPLYARVDMVPGNNCPMLMELEMIEPDLGLRLCPAAADRLAAACVGQLEARPSGTPAALPD